MTKDEALNVVEKAIDLAYNKGKDTKFNNLNGIITKLLNALEAAYRCSGEKNYLTKPVLDGMLEAIDYARNDVNYILLSDEKINEEASIYVDSVRNKIDSFCYLDIQEAFKQGVKLLNN